MKQEIKAMQEKRFANTQNMEERYKNWANTSASLMALMVTVGQELCGEEFLRRVEEVLFENSKANAHKRKDAAGIRETPDCLAIAKVFDKIDDSLANFWDGYVEKSPTVLEKRILTCPMAEAFSIAPVICERVIAAAARGMLKGLNPKADITFTELMSKGDNVCCYRIEIKD